MKRKSANSGDRAKLHRRMFLLAAVLQIGCASLFLADVIHDWYEMPRHQISLHIWLETGGVIALAFAAGLSLHEYLLLLRRNMRMEMALDAASGAFQNTIERHLDAWQLSPAERDVALLSIKGATIPEIARMRGSREGTVKAQNAAIYRKAGVSSRAELISVLIEELIEGMDVTVGAPASTPAIGETLSQSA